MFKKAAIAYLGKKYCKKNTLEKNQMPNVIQNMVSSLYPVIFL